MESEKQLRSQIFIKVQTKYSCKGTYLILYRSTPYHLIQHSTYSVFYVFSLFSVICCIFNFYLYLISDFYISLIVGMYLPCCHKAHTCILHIRLSTYRTSCSMLHCVSIIERVLYKTQPVIRYCGFSYLPSNASQVGHLFYLKLWHKYLIKQIMNMCIIVLNVCATPEGL